MTAAPILVRAQGEIRAVFSAFAGRTHVERAFETGGLRLRYPNSARGFEAVIVNTAGGVAGGDSAKYDFTVNMNADVTLTTQAAEKIYRSDGDAAEIQVSLRVDENSSLAWLPQETIMFAGAKVKRRIDVDIASDASLTMIESLVFGRLAMGEHVVDGEIHDRWRIRRDRRLIFAEEFRLDGNVSATLDRPAIGLKGRATALLLHVGPDAETKLEAVRAALAGVACEWGASAWNGMLVLRFISPVPELQRAAILVALQAVRGCDAPRVWK